MAKEPYFDAKKIIAFIKRDTDTDYVEVGCWTENGFALAPTRTTSNNKCDDGWATSESTSNGWSISGTLEMFNEAAATDGKKSAQTILALAISQETFAVKLANPEGTYYRAGDAAITAYSETVNTGRPTAQVTFTGEGEPVIEAPTT